MRRRTIARVRRIGRHFEISDTRLHVVERGADGLPLLVLHGGPALDHHMFGDYLDPLADEFHLALVDQRSQPRDEPSDPSAPHAAPDHS